LHYKCPKWGDSISSARSEVGFSFELKGDKLWEWLASGLRKIASFGVSSGMQQSGLLLCQRKQLYPYASPR